MFLFCLEPAWAIDPVQPLPPPFVEPEAPAPKPLRFFSLLQSRVTYSDIVTTNPFLDGQVLGQLGGSNGTTTDDEERSLFMENRVGGFFTFAPTMFQGQAELNAAFEIDYVAGDVSYGTGGNTGGGYGADQVNLQTRRLFATFMPEVGHDLRVHVGLQFLSDSAFDPTTSGLDDLLRTGGGLRFFGSEAAGLSAYGTIHDPTGPRVRYRLGTYTLAEQGLGLQDDAQLHMADVSVQTDWQSQVGLHTWWLKDNTGGTNGILGSGPTSALSELQGGPRLSLGGAEIDADLLWIGLDGGWNHGLNKGPIGATGMFMTNIGRLYLTDEEDVDVLGLAAWGEVRGRYARGGGSILKAEMLWTSHDETDDPTVYGGVVTGNSYGLAGAMWTTHDAMILLPDLGSINRQVALAYDISAGGQGMLALATSAAYDLQPNKTNVRLNLAHATNGDGDVVGTEVGTRFSWRPLALTDISITAASVVGSPLDVDPWGVITNLQWLAL